jgi:hypothetical protein
VPRLQHSTELTTPVHFRQPLILTSSLMEQGMASDVTKHLLRREMGSVKSSLSLAVLIHSRDEERDVYIIPLGHDSNAFYPQTSWDEDLLSRQSLFLRPALTLPASSKDDLQFTLDESAPNGWSCYLVDVEDGSFGCDDSDVLFPNLLSTREEGSLGKRSAHNIGSIEHLLGWLAVPTVKRIEEHLANLIMMGQSGDIEPGSSLRPRRRWSGSWCYQRLRSSWGKPTLDRLGITVKTVTRRCIEHIDKIS